MARICSNNKITTDKFNSLASGRAALDEANDCSVNAVAIACDVDYVVANVALEWAGRKHRKGSYRWEQEAAINKLGFKTSKVDWRKFVSKYPGRHKNLKSVTSHHMDRFNKVWADGNTYLVYTDGHVFAVVNGVNHDWTKGRAFRVNEIMLVYK